MAKRPPPRQPPAPQAGELEGRIRQGEVERLRRQAADRGFKDQIQQAAKAKGQDPYQLLAEAIRRLLRGE